MMGSNPVNRVFMLAEGTVKSFNESLGKGLIARVGFSDVYVNRAAIKDMGPRTLTVGEHVHFQVVEGLKGPCAAAVRRTDR